MGTRRLDCLIVLSDSAIGSLGTCFRRSRARGGSGSGGAFGGRGRGDVNNHCRRSTSLVGFIIIITSVHVWDPP